MVAAELPLSMEHDWRAMNDKRFCVVCGDRSPNTWSQGHVRMDLRIPAYQLWEVRPEPVD